MYKATIKESIVKLSDNYIVDRVKSNYKVNSIKLIIIRQKEHEKQILFFSLNHMHLCSPISLYKCIC